MIKFYKGIREKYSVLDHGRGIYFATDTTEILVNGVSYGMSTLTKNELYQAINDSITGVNFELPGKFEFINNEGDVIKTIELATATQQQSGLLASEDKKALDDLIANRFSVKVDDSVIALNEANELFTSIALTYNSGKIQLLGKDNIIISEISTTTFNTNLVDVRLTYNPEGQLPGTYLEFIFNTDNGREVTYVDVSSLIDSFDGSNIYLTGYDGTGNISSSDTLNSAVAKLAKLIEDHEKGFEELDKKIDRTLKESKDYTDESLVWMDSN